MADADVSGKACMTWSGKTWDPSAVQLSSYMKIGNRGAPRTQEPTLTDTHRELDVCSASAIVHQEAQRKQVMDTLIQPAKNGEVRVICICHSYDSTPLNFRFGCLQHEIAPRAKYFRKQPDGKWKMYTLDELRAAGYSRNSTPESGKLDVLARSIEVSWVSERGEHMRKPILLPPCAVEDGGASTLHSAIEDTAKQFGLGVDDLIELSKYVRFVFFSESPDSCKANKRKRAFVLHYLLPHPRVLHPPLPGCIVHLLHRNSRRFAYPRQPVQK